MLNKIRLCNTDEVASDLPLCVNPEGYPAIAVYNLDGNYFATDDLCTHGSASLSEGYQEGDEITCPFHGGAFNIKTGVATAFPCREALQCYPLLVEDRIIYINLEKTT